MIQLDFSWLEQLPTEHGAKWKDLKQAFESRIGSDLASIHGRDQGFYSVIDDDSTLTAIENYVRDIEGRYDDVVVLGIGGSSLGTSCLKQALTHFFEHERAIREHPKLHVLDNIDPSLLEEIDEIIDYKRTLFLVITKSGGTPETLSQFFYFSDRVTKEGLSLDNHFVFVTDPKAGLLRHIAGAHPNLKTFSVPPNVGGRFSVLTAVGLLPAKLMGIDIRKLLEGARAMRDRFLSVDFKENVPFQLAALQYTMDQEGKSIHVMMPYSNKLIGFSAWYRQLLAESIGKALNESGETVHVGLTPVNALGATDQHSQSQLYHEGPNDKFFMMLGVEQFGGELMIPNPYPHEKATAFLKGVSFNRLLHTEMKGTLRSLTQKDRPCLLISLGSLDAHHLGQLFMLFQSATAFLGEFYEINAFNQPGVELSKQLTREMLS